MTQTIFIKPAPGVKVRDPVTKQHLRAEGESKPRSSFWLRRMKAGEVVKAVPANSVQSAQEKPARKSGE